MEVGASSLIPFRFPAVQSRPRQRARLLESVGSSLGSPRGGPSPLDNSAPVSTLEWGCSGFSLGGRNIHWRAVVESSPPAGPTRVSLLPRSSHGSRAAPGRDRCDRAASQPGPAGVMLRPLWRPLGAVLNDCGLSLQPCGVVVPEDVLRSVVRVSGCDGPVVPSTAIAKGASEKISSSPNRPASDDPSVIRRLR